MTGKPIPEAVDVDAILARHLPSKYWDRAKAAFSALTAAQQQGQACEEAATYEQAHRAGESHGRIMAALEQSMQQGGGEVIQRHVVTKYRDGSVHVADVASPPSAPVGMEGLVERWRTKKRGLSALGCANELERALAQQPAAVDEGMLQDIADATAALDKRGDRQMASRLMRLHARLLATQRQEPTT